MSEAPTRPRVSQGHVEECPHLAVREDPQTCLAYPSHWNLCHRALPAMVVRLGHQRKACLTSAHTCCPVFQREEIAPLPVELRLRERSS